MLPAGNTGTKLQKGMVIIVARGKSLTVRIVVQDGDNDPVPWESLSLEEQEHAKKKMLEGANRSWNNYMSEQAYCGA